jgi:hypothetical protein
MSGIIKKQYQLVPANNTSMRNSFEGSLDYPFGNYGSNFRWNPYYSGFRTRFKILASNVAGNALIQPLRLRGVGPNMYCGDCLYQSMYLSVEGVNVDGIENNVAQVSSLKNRLRMKSMQDSALNSLELTQPNMFDRINLVSSDGRSSDYLYYKRNVIGLTDDNGDALLPTNTFAIANTGVITFATGTVPDVSEIFQVGDLLELTYTGAGVAILSTSEYRVSRVINATTIQIENLITSINNVAATALSGVANNVGILLTRLNPKPRSNEFEIFWKPKMGFFDINEWLPSGNYNIKLNPSTHEKYMRHFIESVEDMTPFTDFDTNTITDRLQFRVEIMSHRLEIYKGESVSPPKSEYNLMWESIGCQKKSINSIELVARDYKIHPKSHAVAFAFQDVQAESDTKYSVSKFKVRDNYEQNLTRFYVKRGGISLPQPQYDISITNNVQHIAQVYKENLVYSLIENYSGGVENLQEWLDRGLYVYYDIQDYGGGESSIDIAQQFSTALPTSVIQILVFHFYMKGCKLEMGKEGNILNVIPSK